MHAHTHSFGDYQTTIRLSHRHSVIGVGHTPGEAWRNALACIEERNPDLAGFCAVMKTGRINTAERTTAESCTH